MIHTQLCDLLAIAHPILNAPMGGTAIGDLAAAVSAAGGFGMIGGTSPGGADWLRAQIQAARAQTSRPFGVGFISSFAGTDDLVLQL
jgi:nitronate monooxygenase